jgi:eukaryotic-like serine/threonine-protein kinase
MVFSTTLKGAWGFDWDESEVVAAAASATARVPAAKSFMQEILAEREMRAVVVVPTRIIRLMPRWARIVTTLAAVRIAAAVAIYLSGNAVTPPEAPLPLGVYALLCAAFGFVGATLVTANREDVRASWLGGVLLLLAVPLTSALFYSARVFDQIRPDPFLPAFLLHFAAAFPSPMRGQGLRVLRAAAAVCALVGASIAAVNLSGLFDPIEMGTGDWREFVAVGRMARVSYYWLLILGASAAALLVLAARLLRSSGSDRFRARIFVGGLLAGVMPLLLEVVAEELIPGFKLFAHRPGVEPVIASFLFGAFSTIPFITAYSVLYDRVVELRVALRTAAQYALARAVVMLVTLVPIAALAIYLYQRRSEPLVELFSGSRPLLLAAAALAGAIVIPSRRHLLHGIDRRYFREEFDTGELMANLLSDEVLAQQPEAIATGLAATIEQSMHAHADLYVLDDGATLLVDPRNQRAPLSIPSTLATLVLSDPRPMNIQLSADQSLGRLPPEERAWLAAHDYRLLVGLRARSGSMIGLVAFGHKKSELPFTESERQTIAALAAPLALALENERLHRLPASEEPPAAECVSCSRVHGAEARICSCGGALIAGAAPRSLRGVLRLERRIGRGGMGVVYRGIDLSLNRQVAIKTLPRTSDEHAVRLRNEAQAMASLTHPNLAIIYGLETWRGVPFLIEEYLAGGTLSDRLGTGRLPVLEALDLAIALTDALVHVHASGIVHCDIKPSNIGFAHTGVVKLLDFGLAHLLRRNPTFSTTVATGTAARPATSVIVTDRGVMGTPPYMCPEAVHSARPVPSFDLWAVAVVLYEALSGSRPFAGSTAAEVFISIEHGNFVPLLERRPDCGEELSRFVDRALAKDLRARPPDARVLHDELLRLRGVMH